MDDCKKAIKDALRFLLVWICSGTVFYAYQTDHTIIGVIFTVLSFLYFL